MILKIVKRGDFLKENKLFISLFSIIILIFFIYYISIFLEITPKNQIDLGNVVIPKKYENIPLSSYFNSFENFKADISNVSNQQFPKYIDILKSNTKLNKYLNKKLYTLAFKEYEFLPAYHNSEYNIFFNEKDNYLIRLETYFNYKKKIDYTTNIINTLASNYKDINFYTYIVSDLGATDILNNQKLFIDNPNLVELIISKLGKDISVDYLKYNNLKQYQKYFFKSDHHWNYTGAYQGYVDIVNMFNKNYKNIEHLKLKNYRYANNNIKYRGSLARMAMEYDVYDIMFDGNIDVGKYKVSINNGDFMDNVYTHKENYFNGTINSPDFFSQYADFFHSDYAQIHYQFDNEANRNLIIIADSISDCMDDLIASHFDNTYVIDLRLFNDFKFDEYIKDKSITDVLFLNLSGTMINSFYDKDFEKNFLN